MKSPPARASRAKFHLLGRAIWRTSSTDFLKERALKEMPRPALHGVQGGIYGLPLRTCCGRCLARGSPSVVILQIILRL